MIRCRSNVNTDDSSDFCGCGTMCGYIKRLLDMIFQNCHHVKQIKIIPPKQRGSCAPIKRTCKELNISSHRRSTRNKKFWKKSSNTEKEGRFGHSFIPETGQHLKIKNDTRKKVCEFIQPIVTHFLPNNEGSTHQHCENISIQSKTYEIWRHVINNQPIIRLERTDAN